MVIAVASLAAFIQVLGEACTQASNSLATGRGGVGIHLHSPGIGRSTRTGRAFLGPCLFLLCTCARPAKATISKRNAPIAPESEAALDSPPNSPQDSQPAVPNAAGEASREPILTLPVALTAYIVLLAVIHLRVLLPPELENWTIDVFGFIPKRYDASLLNLQIPGGAGAKVWTFVTYSLLHANLTHLGFNVLWLLPFGSALARRFGAVRFFVFMAVTAAAGALAHLVTHEHAVAPMIGASASVSGAMAAAIRFAFVRGSFLSFSRSDADTAAKVPALPLSRALRDGRVLGFLAVWFGVNIIFGVGAIGVDAETTSVAWQAHIGGFFAGLLLFTLFDPVPRVRSDAADASSQDVSDRI
ncbi:Membrane associated serine protease, rhomboid family [Bradyrhizobium arachidis]|nr:Membrane associated serine protease, rhomboid family [Bradyrhizobium arachidis]